MDTNTSHDNGYAGYYLSGKQGEENGILYVTYLTGQTGVPVEKLLPESMRGDNLDASPIPGFFQAAHLWLVSREEFNRLARKKVMHSKSRDNEKVDLEMHLPPLNLEELKLLNEDGSLKEKRLINLFSIFSEFWDRPPEMGLIHLLVKKGWDHGTIHGVIREMVKSKELENTHSQEQQDFNQALFNGLMPPRVRGGNRIMGNKDRKLINRAIRWLYRPDQEHDFDDDGLFLTLGFKELGLYNSNGGLDLKMWELTTNYIWDNIKNSPDFFALKEYLYKFKLEDQAANPKQRITIIPKNLLKIILKQGRLIRRRGK